MRELGSGECGNALHAVHEPWHVAKVFGVQMGTRACGMDAEAAFTLHWISFGNVTNVVQMSLLFRLYLQYGRPLHANPILATETGAV